MQKQVYVDREREGLQNATERGERKNWTEFISMKAYVQSNIERNYIEKKETNYWLCYKQNII